MSQKIALQLLTLVLLSLGIQHAFGHNQEPDWLDEQKLDGGVYVNVRHPSVLRNPYPFKIRVIVSNVNGKTNVRVREIRYVWPAGAGMVTHSFNHKLRSKRKWFQKHQSLEEQFSRLIRPDSAEKASELAQQRMALRVNIAAGMFSDAYLVDPIILPELWDVLHMIVEVDLEQGGSMRTVRKTIEIPIQAPLPDGSRSERIMRYDAVTGKLTTMSSTVETGVGEEFWFAGDQHLHTQYSIDAYFLNGNRSNVSDYAATAQATGLDWIVVTDHSNIDFNFFGNRWYTQDQFDAGTAQAAQFRNEFGFLVLNGQEMGAGSGDPSHVLAYPADAETTGFLPNPCAGGLFAHRDCEHEQTILDRINDAGGIGFLAHPFQSNSGFFSPWNFDNGVTGWAGLEIFNSNSGTFTGADLQALTKWVELLNNIAPPTGGELQPRANYPTRFPIGLGNSDAHDPGLIGNTFTYCRAPTAMREAIMNSLVGGNCIASNGPLAFVEINGAGPGQVAAIYSEGNTISVTIQSTPEFGAAGNFSVQLIINGINAVSIPPNGSPEYSTTMVFENVFIHPMLNYIVAVASSPSGWLSIANPVWIESQL
ncbi:MAG TPA: hypothetical protein DDW45_05000 [Gammaproteobacteria bacterium]|nr:hypothetical protein [Gammaproteobacteria bacterium]